MLRGRIRRGMSGILLVSLTGAIFLMYVMQKRVSHLEHRFSQLHTSDADDYEVGKDTLVQETVQESARLVQRAYQAAGEVQTEREIRRGASIEHEIRRADSMGHAIQRAGSIEHEIQRADSMEREHLRVDSIEHKHQRADSIELKLRSADHIEDEHRKAGSIELKSVQGAIQPASNDTQQDNQNEIAESVHPQLQTVANKGSETAVDVNPHPYSFVINNPGKCENQDVFLLIVVTTSAENMGRRNGIRQTWGKESNMPAVGIKTVFATGKSNDVARQVTLEEENEIYRDIIQEDFDDTPRNSTLKTIMCLRWASQFCANAEFVLKAEDDTFVNLVPFINYLHDLQNRKTTGLLMGYTYSGTKPLRDPFFIPKWYVSEDDYAKDVYPKYPGGFAYVISNDILRPLYEVSFKVKYFFLEDVYLGICAEKLGIDPTHHDGFYPIFVDVNYCGLDWLLASRDVAEPELMTKFWLIVNACRRVH
ncbi:beta-1,3-galactosyltransferase 1-like [Branchiostoma lanceolatum]|uniref:beta-1,3-galactosyltransferase 1-like n=1 Tax=Branchiostoma lanceolatum TaxID=7740 RepID=UPI00345330DC